MNTEWLKIGITEFPLASRKIFIAGVLGLALSGCGGSSGDDSGDPDMPPINNDDGIFGTGIIEGTAAPNRALARSEVDVKAQSGEMSAIELADNGRFSSTTVAGEGPYLMRVDLGNADYMYSLAYTDENNTRQNLHSYTDLLIRNWFAQLGLDIDGEFESEGELTQLPSENNLDDVYNNLSDIVGFVQEDYNISGTDLRTTSFTADDTGVDAFLDANPVIIDDGQVSIIIVDPETDTQSLASSDIPLNADLAATDNIPPMTPESVRAVPASGAEMIVVWSPSSDNVGVKAYDVYRDGELIATTPYPVYSDVGLSAGTVYSYSVVAIDSSNNESAPSALITAGTAAAPDVTPPDAPMALFFMPGGNTVNLSWQQTGIDDVAEFRILRGEAGSQIRDVAGVTSTFFTDTDIMSGTEYCYRVVAVDGAQNVSDRSEEVCGVSNGTVVVAEPPTDDGGNNGGSNNGGGEPQPPAGPITDYTAIPCTAELEDGTYEEPVTVSAGCYQVNGIISVREGGNLTLEPGVVLQFSSTARVDVLTGGSLTAVGTAGNPVVMTGAEPVEGFWSGLLFQNSNSLNNRIENAIVEYGGSRSGSNSANIEVTASSSAPARITIMDSIIRNSINYGFSVDDDVIIGTFSGNTVTGNDRPITAQADNLDAFDSSSDLSGNEEDYFVVRNSSFTEDAEISDVGIPYLLGSHNMSADVTVAAGADFEFVAGGRLTVQQSGGSLALNGTEAAPITMTGTQATPGHWVGLRIQTSNLTVSHTTISDAGGGSFDASLWIESNSSNPGRLNASHLTISNGLDDGFRIGPYAVLARFDDITSTGNGRSGRISSSSISDLGDGLDLTGNDVDLLRVQVLSIDESATWSNPSVPYSLGDIQLIVSLIIDAGTTMVFDSGAVVRLLRDGSFTTRGTAAEPVVLTGAQAIPGYWDGIQLRNSSSGGNLLEHTVLEYAGGSGAPATSGAIEMDCTSGNPASMTLSNTTIRSSGGWGVLLDREGCTLNVGENVSFVDMTSGDIRTPE